MTKRDQFIKEVRAMTDGQLAAAIGRSTLHDLDARYRKLEDQAGQDEFNEAANRKNISYAWRPSDRVKAEVIAILEYNNAHPNES